LTSTHAPDLSHMTFFANEQKQICQALKGSAPRTATITKRQRGTVCVCVHMCTHTCACMYPQFCSNNWVVLYSGILRQNPLMTVLYSAA